MNKTTTNQRRMSLPNKKCGGWQCPRCHITSMTWWTGEPRSEDAPKCCRGVPMVLYSISALPKICRCGVAWHMDNIECKDA